MSNFAQDIEDIALRVSAAEKHDIVRAGDRQFLVLAEETGEAVSTWRKYTGRAREGSHEVRVMDELADVVITAYVTAAVVSMRDLDQAIRDKLDRIRERGGL